MVQQPPLEGIKVLEFAGLAPGPFAGLLLADSGANVLRIDRAIPGKTHTQGVTPPASADMLVRHKSSIAVDLKSPRGLALVRDLAKDADVIIDPYRPGVLEKLGLGPDALLAINPNLIYGRMTGFRRDGRYAAMAGHDINYLAVSGVLSMLGRTGEKPHPPWNILADFAGGGAMLFQGITLALLARSRPGGKGQIVEANMADGANYLTTFPRMALKNPLGSFGRGQNQLDGGCPFYDTYETMDGKYVAVGALEPQFYAIFVKGLGLDGEKWAGATERWDRNNWPLQKQAFEKAFRSKTRDDWERVYDGTDACVTPVLEYPELEADMGREGDQRPPVALRGTPMKAVDTRLDRSAVTDPGVRGQGKGVEGDGYEGFPLKVGHNGEDALFKWYGRTRRQHYDVENGGLVLKDAGSSKL